MGHEIADARAAADEVARSQSSSEKTYRGIQSTLGDMAKKIEKANLTLADYASSQRKMSGENADILRQLQEAENNANMIAKVKVGLNEQLSDAQSQANHEAKERQILLGKYRNIEHEVAGLKDAFDEEMSSRDNLLRQLSKLEGEAELLRVRYEKEGLAKAEELEMAQLKMQARLGEAESTIDLKSAKLAQLEKPKAKSQADLDAMATQVDQAQILNASMDKRAKQFDRIVGEQKQKVDSISMDLDNSQKEVRIASGELFKVKAAYEESILQLEEVRRENKALSNEIQDIMDQITEGGKSIYGIDKTCKRIEAEKLELEAGLAEAEGALEQEEARTLLEQADRARRMVEQE